MSAPALLPWWESSVTPWPRNRQRVAGDIEGHRDDLITVGSPRSVIPSALHWCDMERGPTRLSAPWARR